MSEFGRNFAVIIGINKYIHDITSLQTARLDAEALAVILAQEHNYQVQLITDEEATLEKLSKLLKIELLANNFNSSDRLLFYFAGHGIARPGENGPEGFLIPCDGRRDLPDSFLPMTLLYQELNQLQCRHLLIILDCCFAGAFRWGTTRKFVAKQQKITKAHYDRFIRFPAWEVIVSSSYNQEALDFLDNRGEILVEGKHSPFAQGLFQGLKGDADLTKDGVITAPELYIYLRDYVEKISLEKQTPGFFPLDKHDRGEYIFQVPGQQLTLAEPPILNQENNPYRGLQSFEEKHAKFFFGREQLIEKLSNFVNQDKKQLTIVVGISGSGKSSLIQGGLIPRLRQNSDNQWQILDPIRPGEKPYDTLVQVLFSWTEETKVTDLVQKIQQNPQIIVDSLKTWQSQHPHQRILLVIDQAEELITLTTKKQVSQSSISPAKPKKWWQKYSPPNQQEIIEEEWQKFVNLLNAILLRVPQLSLLLTLRSDFEPRFQNSVWQDIWQESRFIMPSMSSQELREAIIAPANEMAIHFEPANLVDLLVDEVAQMPGALPLLSFTLSELYINLFQKWQDGKTQDRALTKEDYDKLGGVVGSLTRRANQEYDNLPDDLHRQTMRRVMLRMVNIEAGEAVKRKVFQSELTYNDVGENERVNRVINCLIKSRLIVTGKDKLTNQSYYEPAHDFLVRGWDKLQKWIQTEGTENSLRLQRTLTSASTDWQQAQKSRQFLWNANPNLELLKQVLYNQDGWFNSSEKEFVSKSIARKQFNIRLRWGITFSVILLLGSGLIAALWGQRNARISEIRELQESARLNLSSNPSLDGLLNSLKAAKLLKEDPLLRTFIPEASLQEEVRKNLQWSVFYVRETNRMKGHTGPVRSDFSPDGQLIASAGEDGIIQIWNQQGQQLAGWRGSQQRLWKVAFSVDSKFLVSGGEDGKIRFWNLDGKQIGEFSGHTGPVRSVGFSSDGQILISAGGSGDRQVKIWNLEGEQLASWEANSLLTKTANFSPDQQLIATTGGDQENGNITGKTRIFNSQGELQQEFDGIAWNAVFSSDGKLITVAGDDGCVYVYRSSPEVVNTEFNLDIETQIPQARSQGCISKDLYEPIHPQLVGVWQADNERLWNIAVSHDGQKIATAGQDGSARVWNLQGQELLKFQIPLTGPIRSVNFNPDDSYLISTNDLGMVNIWNLNDDNLVSVWENTHSMSQIIFISQGQKLAIASHNGTIQLWDLQGQLLEEFITPSSSHSQSPDFKSGETMTPQITSPITFISFSDDYSTMVSGDLEDNLYLWDVENQQLLKTFEGHSGPVIIDKENQLIINGRSDGDIILIDINTGKHLSHSMAHTDTINTLSLSPDAKLLASAEKDGTIRVWNLSTQELWQVFRDHIGEVYSLDFSPDGTLLVSGGQDSTIRVWDLQQGKSIGPLFQVYEKQIRVVRFSPDGQFIASGDRSGYLQLWDLQIDNLENQKLIATWKAHSSMVNSIDFSPDGKLLTSIGDENLVKIWSIESLETLVETSCSSLSNYFQYNYTDEPLCR